MKEVSIAPDLSTNDNWVKKEFTRLKNQTLLLIVITFSTLGVLVGYLLLSGLFGNPFNNVTYAEVNGSAVKVKWRTAFPARTQIEYGTSADYLNETGFSIDFEVNHDAEVTGLLPKTAHFFRLVAEDDQGRRYLSGFFEVQ